MSMEPNVYESLDFASPPCYDQAIPQVQAASLMTPSYYPNSNPSGGFHSIPSPEPPELVASLPYPTNSQGMFEKPPLSYNPPFPQNSAPTAPEMIVPQPMMFPSPAPGMKQGIMPPPYIQSGSVPGTVFINTAQPMVMTTHTTVISTEVPQCRDYLPWSIFNLVCCCFIFGTVALIFSVQTRTAIKYRDWESARRKSRVALGFNLTAMLLGIAIIIIVPTVYYTQIRWYYYSYYYYG